MSTSFLIEHPIHKSFKSTLRGSITTRGQLYERPSYNGGEWHYPLLVGSLTPAFGHIFDIEDCGQIIIINEREKVRSYLLK